MFGDSMLKFIKSVLKHTNENLVLVCSLYLFSVVSTVCFAFSQVATNASSQMVILYCLIMVAFFAGFFNQIKCAVTKEEGKFKFLEGIGDYYLPMLGIGVLSLVIYVLFAELGTMISARVLGGTPILVAAVNKIMAVMQSAQVDLTSLDMQALHVVSLYMLILWCIFCVVSFVLLYWVPVLYFEKERNIFVLLLKSVQFLFNKFWKSLFLYIGFLFPIILLSIVSVLLSSIKIFAVLSNLFVYYISVAFLFAVFLLYAEKLDKKKDGAEES